MADQSPVPPSPRDWTVEVTDRIESVVGAVRDKTTVPATNVARMIIFGFVAATLGMVALFLVAEALLRILYVYLPVHPLARRVWVVDAIVAAIFLGSGTFLWRRKEGRSSQEYYR
jgi:hypothetical protein